MPLKPAAVRPVVLSLGPTGKHNPVRTHLGTMLSQLPTQQALTYFLVAALTVNPALRAVNTVSNTSFIREL